MNPLSKDEIHQQLQNTLKKEIELVREILGNLHQEELSLLVNDRTTLNQVIQERAHLSARLNNEQATRQQVTEKLQAVTCPHETSTQIPLNELLQYQEALDCESILLHDQMVTLYQRMHLQNNRNKLLSNLAERNPYRQPQEQTYGQPKPKKITLTTLPREGEEE